MLESDLSRFAPGPLTEVAASTHTWDELAPYIETQHAAAYTAQERVLRGEDLTDDERAHPEVIEMPLRLQSFEPTYALARFAPDHVEVAEPWEPKAPLAPIVADPLGEVAADRVTEVLLDIVQPWVAESNGAARAVVVEGDAAGAIATLTGGLDQVTAGPLTIPEALQRIAWAAASGGAHGRRRGAAFGRFMAFYVVATLGGLSWPASSHEIETAAHTMRWFRWDEGAREEGWILRIAVEDSQQGWSAALGATDLKLEEDEEL